jgi:hypothetical protein
LPDPALGKVSDLSITYEYSTVNSPDIKYRLSPHQPSQNKVKFSLKKASSFRFEMIYYA